MNKILVTLGMALSLSLGALASTPAAMAAPLAPSSIAQSADAGTQTVGRRHRHGRRHGRGYGRHRYGHGHGHYGRRCFREKVKIWSPYYGHYIWETRRICRR